MERSPENIFPEKKPTFDEYEDVVSDKFKLDLKAKESSRFEDVVKTAKVEIEESQFWQLVCQQFGELNAKYTSERGHPLFVRQVAPDLLVKPYSSLVEKSFRQNVLENESYPDSPERGWLLPPKWFSEANDIVRTTIQVKYLDGVDFVIEELRRFASTSDCFFEYKLVARETGYYAAHASVGIDCEVSAEKFDTEIIKFQLEIQVNTELAEVVKALLHGPYERRRLMDMTMSVTKPWQWDYESDEFAVNFLGHSLHHLDGMIMDVRRRLDSLGEDL